MAILTRRFWWGRYLILGLIAGAALQLCFPVWTLAQLGGPQPFWIFCALVVAPLLFFSLVFAKSCRAGEAATGGFLFSVPVAVVCAVLPFETQAAYHEFRFEIWGDGVAVLMISVLLSLFVSLTFGPNRVEGAAPKNRVPENL